MSRLKTGILRCSIPVFLFAAVASVSEARDQQIIPGVSATSLTGGTVGILGAGYTAQGIIGTGYKAQGIIGTGYKAQGIIGTGYTAQGIIGTGYKAQGIIGTGFR
jgi:hypothetical protein